MKRTTQDFGIDTSVFVRLLTGHPAADYEKTVEALRQLIEKNPTTEILVSNQVIGEAYITLQFHYKVSKSDARQAILTVLSNSVVSSLNGNSVMKLLKETGGCGLLDRLIVDDYHLRESTVLTNDKRMAKLPGAQLL